MTISRLSARHSEGYVSSRGIGGFTIFDRELVRIIRTALEEIDFRGSADQVVRNLLDNREYRSKINGKVNKENNVSTGFPHSGYRLTDNELIRRIMSANAGRNIELGTRERPQETLAFLLRS